MKRMLMTVLCAGLLGYGAQLIPWIPNPIMMSIADAKEFPSNTIGTEKDHAMPPADKGHENANANAVEHQGAVQEAVDKALEARHAVLEAKRLELEAAMNRAERKAAVQKAREALHEVQDALHQDIKAMDHEAGIKNPRPITPIVEPTPIRVTPGDPRPVAALEDHPSLSDNAHAVTHAAHLALDEADKDIEGEEVNKYGDNGIHPVIRVMKREVEQLKDGLDASLRAHTDPENGGAHASEIEAVIETAKAGIEVSHRQMKTSIEAAASRQERRKAVETFMADTRSIVEKLRHDLEEIFKK